MFDDDIKRECLQSTRLYQLAEARRYFESKKFNDAHRLFESVLIGPDENLPALLLACAAALYSGQFKRCLSRSDEILKRRANDIQALTMKAVAFQSLNQFAEAQKTIMLAHKLQPESDLIKKYVQEMSGSERKIATSGRSWKRAPIKCSLLVSDTLTGIVAHYKTLSLSGGGCLIEADQLPAEFNFALELSPQYKISGTAERRYRAGSRHFGIAFRNLEIAKADAINQAILKTRTLR